ncbi:restriction endonuclease subunit S [Methylicorpusculum sp.]|uniref:restriction endonuclease subunit S n=2 Tax=Methylicorpusculum sp. TaxID=2713644 RepID=UPI002731D10C|nr:restriction endonuclease subunit S [Methylicorpusculum sp.]MDP2179989.1 restriction endonuclease subunit S [Methylicorpusculum sp.]MDP3527843.1 restriction endonuclease subunit S [Methylicorpusculum sp.]
MSSEWETITLGELTINHDTKRKPVKGPDRRPGPYPYYGASGIVDYVDGYLFDGDFLLIAEDGENLRTRQTPIAFLARGKFWVNNHAHIVTGNERASTRFLMYSLLTADIHSFLTGAVMPKLTQANLNKIPIVCPPREIQDYIVNILGALDDRIALLHETNTTLEAIAQTLFKSWFVDLDPVHAKQQGREPEGMDAETAALFPDSFEESELGLVPSGWRVGTIGQIADTVRSQRKPSQLNSDTNYVGLEHIPRRSLSLANWGSAEGLESAKSCFSNGDILFGKLRPYFHKVVIAPFDGVCSTDILVCQSKLREYYGLVTMHLFSKALIDYAERLSNGAKMPRINWKDLAAYPIVLPPQDLAENYRTIVEPLFQSILANVQQIKTLATLRDTLLPRLISGQLRLPESEAMIEGIGR